MDTVFFLAAKLVKLLIAFETLLALLIALALVTLVRGHLRAARRLLWTSLAAFLAIGLLPLGQLLLAPLERQYPPTPPVEAIDGIILLGGSEDVGPATYWNRPLVNASGDRYLAAIALAERFPEARILMSGGRTELIASTRREASIAETLLTAAGIAPERVMLERAARNTAENARESRALLGAEAGDRWVLVTSASHMPRAVATFCAAGWTGLIPWPTDHRTAAFWPTVGWDLAGHLEDLNAGIKEWVGLLGYRHARTPLRPIRIIANFHKSQ